MFKHSFLDREGFKAKPKKGDVSNPTRVNPLLNKKTPEFPENSRALKMTQDKKIPGLFHEQLKQHSKKTKATRTGSKKSKIKESQTASSKEKVHEACEEQKENEPENGSASSKEKVHETSEEQKEKDDVVQTPCVDLVNEVNEAPWTVIWRKKPMVKKNNKAKKEPKSNHACLGGHGVNEPKEKSLDSKVSNFEVEGKPIEKKCKKPIRVKKLLIKKRSLVLLKKNVRLISKEAKDHERSLKKKEKSKETGLNNSFNKKKRKQTRRKSKYGKKTKFSTSKKNNAYSHKTKASKTVDKSGEVCIVSSFLNIKFT